MSSGSRYINAIYCKTYKTFVMVALSVPTDRGWLVRSVSESLPTVGVADWRCQYLAVHWGLGLDPRLAVPIN